MTWKMWVILIFTAALGGFWYGNSHYGAKMAAKAAVAEQQAKVLEGQVANEMLVRKTRERQLNELQATAQNSDAKVRQLKALLAQRQKVVPVPATGPVTPLPSIPDPSPLLTVDTIKDQLITTQDVEITNLKAVISKQNEILLADNTIIPQLQKELALKQIALDAQVAANSSAKWSGRFQGAGITIGFSGAIAIAHHFMK